MGISENEFQLLKQNQRQAAGLPLRSKRAVTMSEAEMERTCTAMLVQDGWRSLKTSPVSRRARGVGFGELGMADYLYIRYRPPSDWQAGMAGLADVLWCEWKRADGEAAPHQLAWIEAERARGALVWLAGVDFEATPDAFWAHYKASGLSPSGIGEEKKKPWDDMIEEAEEAARLRRWHRRQLEARGGVET
jgi:hypothetical protein